MYTQGIPQRTRTADGRIAYIRLDTWHTGEVDRFWCAGPNDTSRSAISAISGYDYDSRCGLCWLNIGHTMDLHQERIGA